MVAATRTYRGGGEGWVGNAEVNAIENQQKITPPTSPWHKRWVAIGSGIIVLAMFILLLCDNSPEFWVMNLPFTAFTTAISLIFLLPAYMVCFGITILIFRRMKLSVAARRRWVLGPPVLFAVCSILILINDARPSVAIRWITHGKPFKSIHSVHTAHVSTKMSDRSVAWFKIAPEELHSLITQHQLIITNGVDFRGVLRADFLIGGTSIPDRIPSFHDSIYYFRLGSDDFQHPFSVYVLTNPGHDEAVWYTTYDR
jgi:hypothetical protein